MRRCLGGVGAEGVCLREDERFLIVIILPIARGVVGQGSCTKRRDQRDHCIFVLRHRLYPDGQRGSFGIVSSVFLSYLLFPSPFRSIELAIRSLCLARTSRFLSFVSSPRPLTLPFPSFSRLFFVSFLSFLTPFYHLPSPFFLSLIFFTVSSYPISFYPVILFFVSYIVSVSSLSYLFPSYRKKTLPDSDMKTSKTTVSSSCRVVYSRIVSAVHLG